MSEDLKSALSLDIAVAMLKNPEVKIPKDLSLDGIQQFYVEVEHEVNRRMLILDKLFLLVQ